MKRTITEYERNIHVITNENKNINDSIKKLVNDSQTNTTNSNQQIGYLSEKLSRKKDYLNTNINELNNLIYEYKVLKT